MAKILPSIGAASRQFGCAQNAKIRKSGVVLDHFLRPAKQADTRNVAPQQSGFNTHFGE